MDDIELVEELVDVYGALEEAIEDVRSDLAGLGMTDEDNCPLAAFVVYDTAMAAVAELLEDAGRMLTQAADANGSLTELIDTHHDALDELEAQAGEFFELLEFDIEDVLVDLPPVNKERVDDEDAVLYAALDLDEMTGPWRHLMLIAQQHIDAKLEYIEALMTRFLELLQVEGYETEEA